jgi:hypothetical protein
LSKMAVAANQTTVLNHHCNTTPPPR